MFLNLIFEIVIAGLNIFKVIDRFKEDDKADQHCQNKKDRG